MNMVDYTVIINLNTEQRDIVVLNKQSEIFQQKQ